jgi:hypothetical protein
MKTIEDINYEIAFIEQELQSNEFPYLGKENLTNWLSALNWVKSKWDYERRSDEDQQKTGESN